MTVTITAVNDAPVAVNDSATTNEDTAVTITVLANDTDVDAGDTKAINGVTQGAHGTVVANGDGTLTYTPAANYNGSDSFTYTMKDAAGAVSNSATVAVTITAVNDAPVAVNDSATTNEDTAVTITVLANDTDVDAGDTKAINSITQGAHGTVVVNGDGTLTYTPAANYNGSDSFTYTMKDAAGAVSNSATVTVTITAVNDAPVAVNDSATTNEDTLVNIAVLSNDTDVDAGDTKAVASVTQGAHGTVTINADNTVKYTPAANYNGSDSFTYVMQDAAGALSGSATVSVTVTAVNDTPSFTKGADQSVALNAGAQTVANWATAISAGPSNESSQTVNFIVSNSNSALFSTPPAISATGTLTYTPATGAIGQRDGHGAAPRQRRRG